MTTVATTMGGLRLQACQRYLALPDAEARLELIDTIVRKCARGGLKLLLVFLADSGTPDFFRSEGVDLLRRATGQDFGYDPEQPVTSNTAALERLGRHIQTLPRATPATMQIKDCDCDC